MQSSGARQERDGGRAGFFTHSVSLPLFDVLEQLI